jgi:L-ascorbate metabolism protein UlaG (beta-lactamase superfamily)
MRITKYTHACVRFERPDAGVLVIDPGVWTEPAALVGADAVLVTHQHADHVDVGRLAESGLPVYAPAGAEIPGLAVTPVRAGADFTAAGFTVRPVGDRHAVIYGGQPDCVNLGYLVDGGCYHPGDALHVPDHPVETLFVPAQASWLKLSEAIDFVNKVAPARAFPIHDAQVNDRGLGSINHWFSTRTTCDYNYLTPGETVEHPHR